MESEKARNTSLPDMKDDLDFGRPDTLRYNVMMHVLSDKYDLGMGAIQDYVEKARIYPEFKNKSSRYVSHSVDLIFAIKAKKSFSGLNSLTRSKQKEFNEKYKVHVRELLEMLKRIERIYHELKLKDVRSTVYIVRAVWVAFFFVVVFSFVVDLTSGLAETTRMVFVDFINSFF